MLNNMRFQVLFIAAGAVLWLGCTPEQELSATSEVNPTEQEVAAVAEVTPTKEEITETAEFIPTEVITFLEYTDVTYLSIDDLALQLDLAVPIDQEGPYPAIVFIFGGGFREGTRNQYREQIQWAAEQGFVGVTIDHRLNRIAAGKPSNPFPAQVNDVKCAVRWLRANADEYNIDSERIGAVGWSSGGNLALMLALTDPSDGLETDCGGSNYSSEIQAAICIACPIDFTTAAPGGGGHATEYIGGTWEEMPEQFAKASPISYVSEGDPPVLSIFGSEDTNVPASGGELLDARMKEMGLDHELIVLEGKDHFGLGGASEALFATVFGFFDVHLK